MRRPAAVACSAALLVACGSSPEPQHPPVDRPTFTIPGEDWPQFRRDPAGTSASPLPLATAQAAGFAPRWTARVGDSVFSQVVVVGTTVYATSANAGARIVALDLATGAERWSRDLDAQVHASCRTPQRPGIWGSPAVADGIVYVASPDGGVHALDAATGAPRWRAAVASPSPHGELVETSVVVSRELGRAYVGVASTAHCDQIAGRVAAIDLATGAVVSRTLVPDGRRGAAVWASLSVDEPAGVVYVATGNAVGDPASEPYAQALVALDARTLEPRGAWQNPTTLVNADFGGSPTLFEAGGRRLVAAPSKDGWLYVLDREHLAAGPVWKHQLAVLDPGKEPPEGGDPLAGFGSIVEPTLANGLLYAGGGRTPGGDPGAVYAFAPGTGEVRWIHATPGFVLRAPVAVGEVLLVASMTADFRSGTLEILDARSGAPLASHRIGAAALAPPTAAPGFVLWPTGDGILRALAVPRP